MRARITPVLMLLATALFMGCPPKPPAVTTDEPLPTLHDLAPATRPAAPDAVTDAQAPPVARVVRITLPLGRDIEAAWELVGTDGLDPFMVAAWRESGLRIGTLTTDQADAFSAALEQVVSLQTERMSAPVHLDALYTAPRLPGTVDLIVSDPGRFSLPVRVSGGQCRLLARFARRGGNEVEATFVPQHYKSRLTLEARQPWEKLLDGRVFERLALQTNLQPGRVIVIAMDQPPAPPAPEAPPSEAMPDPPQTQPDAIAATQPEAAAATQPAGTMPDADEPSRIPDHFGKWLLGATRMGKPVQTVLVISGE